jgi:hypothetical protein
MINTNEIIIMVIAFGSLIALGRRLTSDWKIVALMALSVIPALFLAVEGATQFLTVDENYMILELENPRVFNYRQWNMGGYRTSTLVTGTLTNMLDGVVLPASHTVNDVHALAKTLHWLLGFGVLVLIYQTIRRGFIESENQKMFFVGFFNLALLLPTNILALKIINYDLLSMMLGMLCVSLTLLALKERRLFPAFLAVIAGSLASQEKIIASPMLALAMFSGTFIAATFTGNLLPTFGKRNSKAVPDSSPTIADRLPWLRAIGVWFGLVLTSMLVVSLTWGIVNALHKGLRMNLKAALDPLVGFLSPIMNRIPETMPLIGRSPSSTSIMEPMIVFSIIGIVGILCSLVYRRVRGTGISRWGSILLLGSVSIVLLLLYVDGFYVQQFTAYVYPTIPVPPGTYIPKAFNGYAYHFMQTSEAAHKMVQFLGANAELARPIPTAIWMAIIVSLIIIVARRRWSSVNSLWSAIAGICLLFPTLYTLTDTPVNLRYLNLFIFTVAFFGFMVVLAIVKTWPVRRQIIGGVVLLTGIILELSMYRPVIASFRPFWSTVDAAYGREPQPGVLKGGWNGWGEEIFLAGERIAREYRKPGESIRIFSGYYGAWLQNDTSIKVFDARTRDRAVNSTDYYVINRAHYETQYPFPFGKTPLFTIDYNGRVMAWVFRGDQLRDRILFSVPEDRGGFVAKIPEYRSQANDQSDLKRSRLVVYENGKRLGPNHAPFDTIRQVGKGHYNHWQDVLFFSASDNTDPRTNGRVYSIAFENN